MFVNVFEWIYDVDKSILKMGFLCQTSEEEKFTSQCWHKVILENKSTKPRIKTTEVAETRILQGKSEKKNRGATL